MPGVAREIMRAGGTREDVARRLRVRPRTLAKWARRYTALRDALREENQVTVEQMEELLVQLARGYRYTETTVTIAGEAKKRMLYYRQARPSVAAISLWLRRQDLKTAAQVKRKAEVEEEAEEEGMSRWEQVKAAVRASAAKYGLDCHSFS